MMQPRTRSIYWAAFTLALLMAATRAQHFGSAVTLPDASLAVFFLGGMLTLPGWIFGLLLGEALLIDIIATQFYGVSDWCITGAYPFLALAYAAMWLGGRLRVGARQGSTPSLMMTLVNALGAVTLAFVISNASFYALSGYFTNQSIAEFAGSVAKYLPSYAGWTLVYIILGWLTTVLVRHLALDTRTHSPAN